VTSCIVCTDREEHDPDYESGWLCCARAFTRMASALRPYGIPRLHAALELDKGRGSAPKVSGTREAPLPLRVDPLDLSMPARHGSLAVHIGRHATDQIGHLSVATELDGYARMWADDLGHHQPDPQVPILCEWLLNRLDWACREWMPIDEFARVLGRVYSSLRAANGELDAPPVPVDRPCDSCGHLSLTRPPDSRYIVCGNCDRALTDDDYAEHLKEVIAMKWTLYDRENKANTTPKGDGLVWIREEFYEEGVTLGYFDGFTFRTWAGSDDCEVSYWAPISYPADPGPAKADS
jgi:hypothetical protein